MGWPLAQQPSGLEPRLQRYCSGSSAICGAMCGDVKWGANERAILNPNLPNSQTKSSAAVAHILGSCRWRWIKNAWQLLMKLWQNTRPCDILLHSIVQNLCVCKFTRVCWWHSARYLKRKCREVPLLKLLTAPQVPQPLQVLQVPQVPQVELMAKCACQRQQSARQIDVYLESISFSIINHHLPFRPFSWLARAFVFACFASVCIT